MTELRYEFGRNWSRFLRTLTDERIRVAEQSLKDMLQVEDLRGRRFLDIGSGSGLFSLAARRLGADVVSFDYDADSVACTNFLRTRYFPEDPHWSVSQGSVLNPEWVRSLGTFDIVYSWGVLHHTGSMWKAIDVAAQAVAPSGTMFIAIYNDQGLASAAWTRIKRVWTRAPRVLRAIIGAPFLVWLWGKVILVGTLRGSPLAGLRNYQSSRGMSAWHDFVDWMGGYPFEVASPEAIFDFCRERGFALAKLRTARGSLGCNEFVFRRMT